MMSTVLMTAIAAASMAASPVTATVRLEPPIIPFHKQATMSVVVEAPAGIEVKLPDMTSLVSGLDVVGFPVSHTEEIAEGRLRTTSIYVLEAIQVRDYPIGPITLSWGENESLKLPGPTLQVRELTEAEVEEAEKFELNAEAPPVRGVLLEEYGGWIAAAAGIGAVAGALAYWLWRRRRAPKLVTPPTPWEVAYSRLRDLDKRKLPEAGRYDEYYVELSSILRHYIEDRLHLRAPEQTTQEFLSAASTSGLLTNDQQQMLAAFLRHCDRVKFAKHEPALAEMERHFTDVLTFVDETVPKPDPEEAKAA